MLKKLPLPTETESLEAFPVIAGHWAIKEIAAMKTADVMNGYEDGTFRPNGKLSRAEAVKIINRMFNRGPLYGVTSKSFKDVPSTHWAFHEVEEAAQDHFFSPRAEGGENLRH